MNGNGYERIIWWSDEDAAYVVAVPDFRNSADDNSLRRD
jgi:predicted RNase H-like HicB family nuclease